MILCPTGRTWTAARHGEDLRFASWLSRPALYKAWQRPVAHQKMVPVLALADLADDARILDLGCGPGSNAKYFTNQRYVGLDLSPEYIRHARSRYQGTFVAADFTAFDLTRLDPPDFVLLNSVLHHVDDQEVRSLLGRLRAILGPSATVNIVDLVLPPRRGIARFLTERDRGRFPRPVEEWRRLFTEFFQPIAFQEFTVSWLGVLRWDLVFFKGRPS